MKSLCTALVATLLAGCGVSSGDVIKVDGSSTVFPITQAVAEEYGRRTKARITIGVSGTGGGFKKLCRGEVHITGASRPIKAVEREQCAARGIRYIELPIAYDGLAVVVNPDNDWVTAMTTAELKRLWEPRSPIDRWNELRGEWPKKRITLLGPGTDSGTYDYFTKAVVGSERASRADFTSSEDDNVLVKGVSTDKGALAFFGYAYYIENKTRLKLVPIDDGNDENGAGPIAPSLTTVADGTYQPLSRPVFIYVNASAAGRSSIKAFVDYYLRHSTPLVEEVGYIPLPAAASGLVQRRFEARTTGTLFAGGSKVGVTIEQLLGGG